MDIENKVALVTGSSSGIGSETVKLLAKKGAKVIITYYTNQKKAEEIFRECASTEKNLLTRIDLQNNFSIDSSLQKIRNKYPSIDILINNAGVISWKNLENQSYKEISSQIDTNLTGVIKMTKACLPLMNGGGTIINISSGAGLKGHPGLTSYCASKFGVIGFTEALSKEINYLKIYSLNPGKTATSMNNYAGTSPSKISELILKTLTEEIKVDSGDNVDLWRYL